MIPLSVKHGGAYVKAWTCTAANETGTPAFTDDVTRSRCSDSHSWGKSDSKLSAEATRGWSQSPELRVTSKDQTEEPERTLELKLAN